MYLPKYDCYISLSREVSLTYIYIYREREREIERERERERANSYFTYVIT